MNTRNFVMKHYRRMCPYLAAYDRIPWWAGVWYNDIRYDNVRLAPLGVNILLRVTRAFVSWVRHPFRWFDYAHEIYYWRNEYYKLVEEVGRSQWRDAIEIARDNRTVARGLRR
jgi:hypothetical protein